MDPFVGEIRPFPYNFAPNGWQYCDGSLLLISGNEALFQLIGTSYGGDGQTTFGVPDLRSRVPMHMGSGSPLSAAGGVETVALNSNQLPSHAHGLAVSTAASSASPVGAVPGQGPTKNYGPVTGVLAADSITPTGNGVPHENRQPSLAIGYAISLFGVYPTFN